MDIFSRRRQQLVEILKSTSVSQLHKASGVAASSISSCLKQLPDGRYLRNIGEVTARKLERGAKKPEGWLDGLVSQDGASTPYKPSITTEYAVDWIGVALEKMNDQERRDVAAIFSLYATYLRDTTKADLIAAIDQKPAPEILKKA